MPTEEWGAMSPNATRSEPIKDKIHQGLEWARRTISYLSRLILWMVQSAKLHRKHRALVHELGKLSFTYFSEQSMTPDASPAIPKLVEEIRRVKKRMKIRDRGIGRLCHQHPPPSIDRKKA